MALSPRDETCEAISQNEDVSYNEGDGINSMTIVLADTAESKTNNSLADDPVALVQRVIRNRGAAKPKVGWFICRGALSKENK